MPDPRTTLETYARNWSYVDEDCGPQCAPEAIAALRKILDDIEKHSYEDSTELGEFRAIDCDYILEAVTHHLGGDDARE